MQKKASGKKLARVNTERQNPSLSESFRRNKHEEKTALCLEKGKYMRKVLRLAISLIPIFALLSCVSGINMNEIQNIHRGMTHDDFKTQVTIAPKSSFPIEHEGVQYSIEIYNMQTGTRTQSQYVWSQYGGYTMVTQVPVYDDYVFVFDGKGLFTWGFLNELQKSDDELVQQLAPEISAEIRRNHRSKRRRKRRRIKG